VAGAVVDALDLSALPLQDHFAGLAALPLSGELLHSAVPLVVYWSRSHEWAESPSACAAAGFNVTHV